MNTSFPTPNEFNSLSDRQKQSAYLRLYRHWQAKGGDKREWRNARRRGAREANKRYASVINLVIKTFWDNKHHGIRVTANSLDSVQRERFTTTAMASGTIVNWNTSLRFAWNSQTWENNEASFERFSTKARQHRSRSSNS